MMECEEGILIEVSARGMVIDFQPHKTYHHRILQEVQAVLVAGKEDKSDEMFIF